MKSFSIRSLSSLIFPRDRLINQLEKLLGSKNVLCDPTDCEPFNTDWKGVHKTETSSGYDYSIVVTPCERSEVVGLMKFCHENKIAVCPQGGNTGLVGGSVPISSDEVIVSFSKMNRESFIILSHNYLVAFLKLFYRVFIDYLSDYGRFSRQRNF